MNKRRPFTYTLEINKNVDEMISKGKGNSIKNSVENSTNQVNEAEENQLGWRKRLRKYINYMYALYMYTNIYICTYENIKEIDF